MVEKRALLNLNIQTNAYDYMFINHVKNAAGGWGPYGGDTAWYTSTPLFSHVVDANGYINVFGVCSATRRFGGGVKIPDSSNFAGPYVLTWDGDGEIQFLEGTWTVDSGASSGYTQVSNGRWHGIDAYIVMDYTGDRDSITMLIRESDRSNTGAFFTNLRFYRLEDEADLLAGKMFRQPWKDACIALNPSAIRFMNWVGNGVNTDCRWEFRASPDSASYCLNSGFGAHWGVSPPYGVATGINTYTLASATGMPVAMTHGEIVTCRFSDGFKYNIDTDSFPVTAITQNANGRVTCVGHGLATGDVIVLRVQNGIPTGMMLDLDRKPVTITVIDADTFDLNVNTSGFAAFATSPASVLPFPEQYITLNVGARGAYPICYKSSQNASEFGDVFGENCYKSFTFDSELNVSTDITGAWIFQGGSASSNTQGLQHSFPVEACMCLIAELNEESTDPINMWINIPTLALLSTDPDYDADSNFAVKMIERIIDGGDGYPAYPAQCNLFIEYSNETWNTAFFSSTWCNRRGQTRYSVLTTDTTTFSTIRTIVAFEDIKAALPGETRLRFVIAGQGTLGIGAGTGNFTRCFGNATYDGDAWNIWADDPLDHCHHFAYASYWHANTAFSTANLATYTANWVAAVGDAAKEAVCADYVANGLVEFSTGGNETIERYRDTLLPAYAAALLAEGKTVIQYEGGTDFSVTDGTTDQDAFRAAVKRCEALGAAIRTHLEAFAATDGAEMPAFPYVQLDPQFGEFVVDAYESAVGGPEWSVTSPSWDQVSEYNNQFSAADQVPNMLRLRLRLHA